MVLYARILFEIGILVCHSAPLYDVSPDDILDLSPVMVLTVSWRVKFGKTCLKIWLVTSHLGSHYSPGYPTLRGSKF